MNTRSIRTRITGWYAAIFVPLLGGIALAAWGFLSYTSQERVDEFLAESGATIAAALEFERRQGAEDSVALRTVVAAMQLPDVAIHIRDRSNGQELTSVEGLRFRRTTVRDLEQSLIDSLVPRARRAPAGAPALMTLSALDQDVRMLTLPYTLGHRQLIIAVAQVMTARSRMLRDARLAIGIGLPVALLLALTGGWWLAGRALSPVDAMTRRAARIGATNLHERLPVPARQDELGRLATVLNGLLSRLEGAFEAQARFAADASHELRTPVAVISGEAEHALSRDDRSPVELREALKVVYQETARVRHIVDDLFFLARADAGERLSPEGVVDLQSLAEDSGRALRSLGQSRQVSIAVRPGPPAVVPGDHTALRRAMDNLLGNAVKFSRPGGTCTVHVEPRGAHWCLQVRDAGPGIAAGDRERLFERFYRGPAARAAGIEGSGLGLAIVRSVARAHGGEVQVTASDDTGSTFELLVPAPRTAT